MTPAPEARFIRGSEVCHRTGLSKTTLRRMERRGAFPRHYRISMNAIAWLSSDLDGWVERQIAVRHRAVAENETLLTTMEVRRRYLLLQPTLQTWVRRGLLRPVLIDGHVRFSAREVERLIGITTEIE